VTSAIRIGDGFGLISHSQPGVTFGAYRYSYSRLRLNDKTEEREEEGASYGNCSLAYPAGARFPMPVRNY